ncbi:DoxX family membrane protein [Actinomadura luteofluorescens]|uniref:DoxX family membrane protein n=1 Tax=Actinomadura luteofluorescens TaxID=46163 RepID=UPI003493C120
MRPFTTLARPFVAAPYIMTGLEALRDPRERAERVGPAVKPVADRIDWLPKDPETLVRMQGALSLGTGALLLTGKFRRLTTLVLAAQLVPALATEHRYWTESDPERRANERSHLLKNAGMFGALLMVATEPRRTPRTAELRRAVRETQIRSGAEAKAMRREAAATLREARREASRQVRAARAEGGRKAAKASRRAKTSKSGGMFRLGKASGRTSGALTTAGMAGGALKAGKAGGKAGGKAARKAGGALKSAGASGALVAGKAAEKATKAGKARGKAGGRAGGALKGALAAGGAFKLGRASKPGKAARAGQAVKAGTATQAAKAAKAGRTVKAGTAAQAGKALHAVKR